MAKQLLLLDGDHILHRCCAATEHETKWDEDNRVLVSNVEEAWDTINTSIQNVFKHFGETNHVIAMGSQPYFRHTLHPEYKAGRGRKPLGYHDVKERVIANYNVVNIPGIEADDIMGILATKPNKVDKIIVAKDKDMKSVPGKLWDGVKFHVVTEAEANYWHLYQTLVGDRTDNYPGCPGIGPKKAEKILSEEDRTIPQGADSKVITAWQAVVDAFGNAGLSEAEALKQARIARILRWSDWDSEKKEPILWTPSS